MKLFRRLRRYLKAEDGSSTIEFVLIFPTLFFLFLNVFDMGILLTRHMMFERAVDIVARDVRITQDTSVTAEDLADKVCLELLIIRDCISSNSGQGSMVIEMARIEVDPTTGAWAFPRKGNVACQDRSVTVTTATEATYGLENEVMMFRACLKAQPFFQWTAASQRFPVNADGEYTMVATSAFTVEPNQADIIEGDDGAAGETGGSGS